MNKNPIGVTKQSNCQARGRKASTAPKRGRGKLLSRILVGNESVFVDSI